MPIFAQHVGLLTLSIHSNSTGSKHLSQPYQIAAYAVCTLVSFQSAPMSVQFLVQRAPSQLSDDWAQALILAQARRLWRGPFQQLILGLLAVAAVAQALLPGHLATVM